MTEIYCFTFLKIFAVVNLIFGVDGKSFVRNCPWRGKATKKGFPIGEAVERMQD